MHEMPRVGGREVRLEVKQFPSPTRQPSALDVGTLSETWQALFPHC